MNIQDQDQDPRAEAVDFGTAQGGMNAAHVEGTRANLVLHVRKSIEDLNSSSGRLTKLNLLLTGIVLLVAILQALLAGYSPSHRSNQRFTVFTADADMTFVLDTKTGLSCATGFTGASGEKDRVGDTLMISNSGGMFAPFCADLYANEDRVLRDFQSYLRRPGAPQTQPSAR